MSNLSQTDRKKLDNYNAMSVGVIFRKTREAKSYDIMQIATHLNINSTHLIAIENDDYDHLPQKVYAVGFVRAYADLLELDADKMAYLFKVQAYGKKQTDHQKKIVQTDDKSIGLIDTVMANKGLFPIILVGVVSIGLIVSLLIFLGVWIFSENDEADQMRIPEVPESLLQSSINGDVNEFITNDKEIEIEEPIEPMDMIVRPGEGGKTYGVEPLQSALVFKMLDKVWVEIRAVDTGAPLISKKMNKGDVFYLSPDQDILFSSANGGLVEAYLDGQLLGALGNDGDTIRLRPFSVKALRLQRGG